MRVTHNHCRQKDYSAAGDCSRCSATELGVIGSGEAEGEVKISNQPTRFPGKGYLHLLELPARKNQVDGRRLEGEGLCDPQGMWTRVGKAATGVLDKPGNEPGGLEPGEEGKR